VFTLSRNSCLSKFALFEFMGVEANTITNLESLSHAVHWILGRQSLPPFRSFTDFFLHRADITRDSRIVLVMDEYPYLAAVVPEKSPILRPFCNHDWPAAWGGTTSCRRSSPRISLARSTKPTADRASPWQ